MKKIAIYGGSFDPVHHGHLILAREALEKLALDKILFIPAALSPFKKSAPNAGGEVRLAMLRAAIQGETGFAVDDCELRRRPPSYTIETVEQLRQHETDAEIHVLIGEDNVDELSKWHHFADLEKLVRFVVLDRTGREADHHYPVIQRKIDISATEIRKRVAAGESIRYLVPQAVEEIIRRENLYREQPK